MTILRGAILLKEANMAKIIHFPKQNDSIESFLHAVKEAIQAQKIEKIAIAGLSEDGTVVTGYYDCDVGDKQVLAAHIQTDVVWDAVRANIEGL